MKKAMFPIITTVCCLFFGCGPQAQPHYTALRTFHIPGAGDWDYITVDESSNKLYVTHWTHVNILDKFTGDSLGIIPNTEEVHGVALVHSAGKGYTSNGGKNNVTVFDLATTRVITNIPTGQGPDAIFYDDYSKKIITCNGESKDLSIIDPATDKVTATVPLSGKPETAVSDGAGKIFVNIEDKSTICVVNADKHTVMTEWAIAPGSSPHGLAIDRKTQRLFAGCENRMLVVLDATNGKVVAHTTIGEGSDGVAFDAGLNYIFSSNGSGTLTVIEEVSKDEYKVVGNMPTKETARTIAVDGKTHHIYLPFAVLDGPAKPGEWPEMKEGTFQVLVMERD